MNGQNLIYIFNFTLSRHESSNYVQSIYPISSHHIFLLKFKTFVIAEHENKIEVYYKRRQSKRA